METYILGIDQSTQGTKLVLFDESGAVADRVDRSHDQIVNERGWVSHDMNQVWFNILDALKELVTRHGLDGTKGRIAACGISNQRETTVSWGGDGVPLAPAIVWQCGRASAIAERLSSIAEEVFSRTGLELSPFYPAAKMVWLLEDLKKRGQKTDTPESGLHLGTVDSYLIYRMTKGSTFATDTSNASRTQLMNLETLCWDETLLSAFGIPVWALPGIRDSDAAFGVTDFDGVLPYDVPVTGAMGDSHAALFGHGCHLPGMTKATYGTGSSVMMNTGSEIIRTEGLSASVAYRRGGQTCYCAEGNINYTGAVISWLKNDVGLIDAVSELEPLVRSANPQDRAVLVPAFSGLSAPWWEPQARASLSGMTRTTGRAEIARAATESIAMQIADVCERLSVREVRVDGGPTRNRWLIQFQADMLRCPVRVPAREELSAMGAAYLAGISAGYWKEETLFFGQEYESFLPEMQELEYQERRQRWKQAVRQVLASSGS